MMQKYGVLMQHLHLKIQKNEISHSAIYKKKLIYLIFIIYTLFDEIIK